ncbi:MAG TPA: HAMP domain-containing sensor histidine kinase [Kofleriaceae bacterium]|nr:HAMP domain-containing sensor histidine kinase [Kofleriaceae bacterium]
MSRTLRSRSRLLPVAVAAVLLLLLALLAHLQWRWIGEVSALERHRLEMTLLMTGARLAEDVDVEVTRVVTALHPDLAMPADRRVDAVIGQVERWRREAAHPGLVGAVYLVGGELAGADARAGAGGGVTEAGAAAPWPAIVRLDEQEARFVPAPWPPDLASLRDRLRGPAPALEPAELGRARLVAPGVRVLLMPFASWPTAAGAGAEPGDRDPLGRSLLVVELRESALAADILPRSARDALAWGAGEDVMMSVIDPSRPGHVVYRSDPAAPSSPRDADVDLPLLGAHRLADLPALWGHCGGGPCGPRHVHDAFSRRHHDVAGPVAAGTPPGAAVAGAARDGNGKAIADARADPQGSWRLLLRRRGDSLEQAVGGLRWHNLAVSLGLLGLLAAAAVILVATTQRAHRLARQQIEFVAGVTHELHTPLAAIRAAGENLADGVVADADRVRRYGALIEGEGRRLSTLVAQLLELAGIQSGRRVYRFEPVDVGQIVDGALRESELLLEEAGVAVERDLPASLPPVLADAGALRRGLQNLVENAVKHAGESRWLGVRVRAADGGVAIAIADRGPGIARDELPHLFEPFFRGRDAAAGGVPGVGLGLALVHQIALAHGGRVSAANRDGPERGATFTLHLPAAPPAAVAAPEPPA